MKRTVSIFHEHSVSSGAHIGRWAWTGIFTDTLEAFDYDTKEGLIESCKKEGYNYKVLRCHRNGKKSVVERSEE